MDEINFRFVAPQSGQSGVAFQRKPEDRCGRFRAGEFPARHMMALRVICRTMTDLPKPDVIITHESDLDGLISGALLRRLARKLYGEDVRLEAYHYNFWKQREPREQSAWVADLTFEARLDRPGWVIIDHHVTDAEPKYATVVHDVTKSAGSLCYDLCREHGLGSPTLDRLVHLNNVADLFLEDDPDFVSAVDHANLVKIYQFWNLYSLIDGEIEKLLDHPLLEVMQTKRRVEDPLGYLWSKSNVAEISPTIGYVETVVGNNNLIVHQLLERQATKYVVLITLFRKANNTIIVSLRSRNGEALKAAEKLQGGGHANACGAVLPRSVRNISEALDYLRKVFHPTVEKHGALNSLESLFAAVDLQKRQG
jgi:oligoribonuclease NrnB/cAMP/cGMP phosphodiesterase (DHH superfamily)